MPVASTELTTYGYGRPTQAIATSKILSFEGQGGFIVKYDQNGQAIWKTRLMINSGSTITVAATTTDISGNVYATGSWSGELYIYNANDTAAGSMTSGGGTDAFILKFDSSGSLLWATSAGGTLDDSGRAITVDTTGNIYVVGGFTSSPLTVYQAPFRTTAATLTWLGTTGNDVFILRYTSSGALSWSARLSSAGDDLGLGVAVSGTTLFVTGTYAGTLTVYNSINFNGNSFGTLSPIGGSDIFLVRYVATTGQGITLSRIGGTSNDSSFALTADASGNAYVAGSYGDATCTVYNNPGTNVYGTLASSGALEAFIVKYDNSFNGQWRTRIGGALEENVSAIAVDSSENVYVTGFYTSASVSIYNQPAAGAGNIFGTMTNPNGASAFSTFLVKYNRTGSVLWATKISGRGGTAVSVDSSGNVYVAGSYSTNGCILYNVDTSIFKTLPGDARGAGGTFIAKYDQYGVGIWATYMNGGANIAAGGQGGLDASRNFVIGGSYSITGTSRVFSPSTALQPIAYSSVGSSVCVKYNRFGVPQWAVNLIPSNSAQQTMFPKVDRFGNVFIGSYLQSMTSFQLCNQDGSVAESFTFSTSTTRSIVTRYTNTGYEVWMASIAGGGILVDIDVDSNSNVYAAGYGSAVTFHNKGGGVFGSRTIGTGGSYTFMVKYNPDGIIQWVIYILPSNNAAVFPSAVKVDSSDNIILYGQTTAPTTATFIDSSGSSTFSLSLVGTQEGYLVKCDPLGNSLWATHIGRSGANSLYAGFLDLDDSNNIYLSGFYRGTGLDFYNQPGTVIFASLVRQGNTDNALIVKYDSNGNGIWATRIDGPQIYGSLSVDTKNNRLFLSGYQYSTLIPYNSDGTNTVGRLSLRPFTTGSTMCILAYDLNGNAKWVNNVGTPSIDTNAGSVIKDGLGNVLVIFATGISADTMTVYKNDGSEFTTLSTSSAPSSFINDAFLIKYNGSTGDPIETTLFGLSNYDLLRGKMPLALDSSTLDYYVCVLQYSSSIGSFPVSSSRFIKDLESNSTSGNAFLVKYDTVSTRSWATTIRGTNASDIKFITTDRNNNIYTIGAINTGNQILHSTNGIFSTISLTNATGALIKYNRNGIVQWVSPYINEVRRLYSVAVDASGNVYAAGSVSTTGTSIYNSDGSLYRTITGIDSGVTVGDSFLVQYNANGMVQWLAIQQGSAAEVAWQTAVDFAGNVFIFGIAQSQITIFNADGSIYGSLPGSGMAFLVKYNSSGNVIWMTRVGQADFTDSRFDLDSGGNPVLFGQFFVTTSAYNQPGIAVGGSISDTGSMAYIASYTSDGFVRWITRIKPTSTMQTFGCKVDPADGSFYITGSFFGTTLTIYNVGGAIARTLTNSGTSNDGFLIKYNNNGIYQWAIRLAATNSSLQEVGYSISIGPDRTVYVVGFSQATLSVADANGNVLVYLRNTSIFTTRDFGFILGFSRNGGLLSSATIQNYGTGRNIASAVDSTGAVYTGGYVAGKRIYAYSA